MSRSGLPALAHLLLLLGPQLARAQISAAAPAGGIDIGGDASVAITRVAIRVTTREVEWSYVLVNRSDALTTREVRLPLPDRWFDPADGTHAHDFEVRAWVGERKLVLYPHHAAVTDHGDVTAALHEAGLTPESFAEADGVVRPDGVMDDSAGSREVAALPAEKREQLLKLGALCDEGTRPPSPCWKVKTTYRWQQQFPPDTPVRIRIRYASLRGYEHLSEGSALKDSCADARTVAAVRAMAARQAGDAVWHELLLAGPGMRQGTIPDFELTVERPQGALTSFCWPGKIERRANGVFRVRARDYAPPGKLSVAFFGSWDVLE